MNPAETCLLKNKITEAFIYDSENQYLMPNKHDKYKISDLEKLKIQLENSTNSKNQSSSTNTNIFSTTQVLNKANNDSAPNNAAEKKILLVEIEHIIEDLEYFEKERRKNQMIEIMKSITRNVDPSTIPSVDDILDEVFFGKSQEELIGEYTEKQRFFENQIKNSLLLNDKNFDMQVNCNINSHNSSGSKSGDNILDINKVLMDDDKDYEPTTFLHKKTYRKHKKRKNDNPFENKNKRGRKKEKIFENVKKAKAKNVLELDDNVGKKVKLNETERKFDKKNLSYHEGVFDFDIKKINK